MTTSVMKTANDVSMPTALHRTNHASEASMSAAASGVHGPPPAAAVIR